MFESKAGSEVPPPLRLLVWLSGLGSSTPLGLPLATAHAVHPPHFTIREPSDLSGHDHDSPHWHSFKFPLGFPLSFHNDGFCLFYILQLLYICANCFLNFVIVRLFSFTVFHFRSWKCIPGFRSQNPLKTTTLYKSSQ
jgi:hypothetical protein